MKGLKKIALVSAIAAASAGAQAELKALDDSAMGELTGQAGLTIDIETQWSIGEFAYHDAGVVVIKDLSMGGNSNEGTNTMLDNIRLTLDVAGANEELNYGMSKVRGLAAVHSAAFAKAGITNAEVDKFDDAAGGYDFNTELYIDNKKTYNDGDLVLHFAFNDAWQKSNSGSFAGFFGGGAAAEVFATDYSTARDMLSESVDFEFNIGQIALADSSYADTAGSRLGTEVIQKTDHATGLDQDDGGATTTTLISDFSMKGYLGPMDIRIQNNGNGFGKDGSYLGADIVAAQAAAAGADPAAIAAAVAANNNGTGNADSKIEWDSFFKVTDLSLYIDIAGVKLEGIKIHNVRGDLSSLNEVSYDTDGDGVADTTANSSSLGFAHSKREIFAVKDTVLNVGNTAQANNNPDHYVDGIAINTQFKGDIDIGHLSFGDTGTSIGSIYLTDIESTTNWTISAH